MLFNIALVDAIRRDGVQRSGTIVTRSNMFLGFADDVDDIRTFQEGDSENRTHDQHKDGGPRGSERISGIVVRAIMR